MTDRKYFGIVIDSPMSQNKFDLHLSVELIEELYECRDKTDHGERIYIPVTYKKGKIILG